MAQYKRVDRCLTIAWCALVAADARLLVAVLAEGRHLRYVHRSNASRAQPIAITSDECEVVMATNGNLLYAEQV